MEHSDVLNDYYDALDRLRKNTPTRTPKGARITNDAVSIEAGRGKGSIKKSRSGYSDLIAAIDAAAEEQRKPEREVGDRLLRLQNKIKDLEQKLQAALGREMSLVYELFSVRKKLQHATGDKVVPIRRRNNVEN